MAMKLPTVRIIVLDKHRALVPHGTDFIETVDGYDPKAEPPWPGAQPEQLHPWPVPPGQAVIICECPHEQCADPIFESHTSLTETTCCPNCGRQQSPHPVTDLATIRTYLRSK